jgi:hypothetical protein
MPEIIFQSSRLNSVFPKKNPVGNQQKCPTFAGCQQASILFGLIANADCIFDKTASVVGLAFRVTATDTSVGEISSNGFL